MRRLLVLVAALLLAVPVMAQDYPEDPPADPYPEQAYPTYPDPTPTLLGYGTFIFQNWTTVDVDFAVDGVSACRAYANSSCTTQSPPGRHYLTGRAVIAQSVETSETADLEDGATITWTVQGDITPPAGGGGSDPAPPQGTGYGTIQFLNQTAFQFDFYIDGSYACRAWANNSCTGQATVGTHYVSGKSVEDTPRETTGSVEVVDGGESTWTLTGGGDAPTGYGTIEVKNYSVFQLDAYSDGVYLCRAEPSSSCTGQASVGTHSVMVRTVEATPRESPPSSIEVGEGATTTVEFSGGGDLPTGYGTIEVKNESAFQIDAYNDGAYLCRAESARSCSGQASVGTHAITVRTVEATPRESSAASVEVVEGGTSTISYSGGGDAPTGFGTIEFVNETDAMIELYVDRALACSAQPQNSCTAKVTVGSHSVTARTIEATPRESEPASVEIVDGGTTTIRYSGGEPAAASRGTVIFENQSGYLVAFYIDGLSACRATARSTCSAETSPGMHNVRARTLSDPSYTLDGMVEVVAGAVARYAIGNAANAQPPP